MPAAGLSWPGVMWHTADWTLSEKSKANSSSFLVTIPWLVRDRESLLRAREHTFPSCWESQLFHLHLSFLRKDSFWVITPGEMSELQIPQQFLPTCWCSPLPNVPAFVTPLVIHAQPARRHLLLAKQSWHGDFLLSFLYCQLTQTSDHWIIKRVSKYLSSPSSRLHLSQTPLFAPLSLNYPFITGHTLSQFLQWGRGWHKILWSHV